MDDADDDHAQVDIFASFLPFLKTRRGALEAVPSSTSPTKKNSGRSKRSLSLRTALWEELGANEGATYTKEIKECLVSEDLRGDVAGLMCRLLFLWCFRVRDPRLLAK